mmetsp:Transcript_61229/g.73646  ORF Transcript_61229/g.73646 Transcript_61229/m.73646 type:complete len:405 (-) Transcript_61229:232-1446(-)
MPLSSDVDLDMMEATPWTEPTSKGSIPPLNPTTGMSPFNVESSYDDDDDEEYEYLHCTTSGEHEDRRSFDDDDGDDDGVGTPMGLNRAIIRTPKFYTRRRYYILGFIALVIGAAFVAYVVVPTPKDTLSELPDNEGGEIVNNSGVKKIDEVSEEDDNNKVKVASESHLNDVVVMNAYSHDSTSFTQGLTYANGVLYESTGLYKESKVRRHDMSTGEILNGINIPKEYFGEGLAYYPKNNTLIQLTWKKRSVFIYDADSLQQLNKIQFQTGRNEGWGITYYPIMDVFIVSDGSNNLYFWDVVLMQEISRVSVTWQDGSPRDYLNELEYDPATGLILSNVWYEDYIVAIDPTSGVIQKKLDLEFVWLKKDRPKGADVLNGISVTNEPGVFLITGKKWPKMYFVKLG